MVSEPASHWGCRTKELFYMGSEGNGKLCRDDVGATSDLAISARKIYFLWIPKVWREAVFRYAFCVAWARILLLFGCFGTGLQRTCANGFGTTSAARVPDKRWREAAFRYAFCLAWARILLLFGCFGTGLQRTCANGFGTTSAARVPDKSTGVYGFQR